MEYKIPLYIIIPYIEKLLKIQILGYRTKRVGTLIPIIER